MDGLSSVCAGLGIFDEDDNGKCVGYAKGEFCSDNLKDLVRFLRRDDPEKRDVFKQVCKWNIVSKDLVPIILYCQEDHGLVLNAVKVLVFLTMPIEPSSVDIPQQMEYLWGLKSAITYSDILPVIMSFLENPLENLENENFTEDDWKLVQLVLTLFRNILAINDISTQQKAGGCATQFLCLRDKCLEIFFQENVMDMILALTLHIGGSHGYLHHENMLLLEIFHCIFKGQTPELIAKAFFKDSKDEDGPQNAVNNLQSIMKEEKEKRKLCTLQNLTRHSQFSGTFTRTLLDGSKALHKGNPSVSGVALLKANKNCRGPSKREIWDQGKLASERKIQQLLNEFINQFLMGGYNVLMASIREDIDTEHQEFQCSDVVIFFEVAQFITSFQYYKSLAKPSLDEGRAASTSCNDDGTSFNGSMCGPIAETMTEAMFLLVISKWRYAFEGLKQTSNYKFLSVGGSLVKIMICMLDLVLKQAPEDSNEPHTARILLFKLFYDQTEEGLTHFLFTLVKSFDPHKQPKSDLTNLVESIYLVLRLLEKLQANGTLRVSKKLRKKKKKKVMNENKDIEGPGAEIGDPKNDTINSISEESVHERTLDNDMAKKCNSDPEDVPFNSISEESVHERTLDNDMAKNCNSEPEDVPLPQLANPRSGADGRNNTDHDGCSNIETDKSSGDEQPVLNNEVDFKVSSLVTALANHTMIQKLCWLLSNYRSNSITTNHYIISMLRRVCDDLDLSPMLYQLSFLTVFYEILEEQKSRPCKEYENIVNFLTTLIRRMLRKMKSYPLLFVEILFRKTTKECRYINCGSMLNEMKDLKNATSEQKANAYGGISSAGLHRSIAEALGDDDFEVSCQDHLEEKSEEETDRSSNKGSGAILSDEMDYTLQDLYLKKHKVKTDNKMKITPNLKPRVEEETSSFGKLVKSRKRVHAFSSDEEQKIKELFDQFKDHKRCSYMIAQALDGNGTISATRVSYKLKQLGLIVPKKKRSQAKMQLVDEVLTDLSSGESDDETLLSLKTRHKRRMLSKNDDELITNTVKDSVKSSAIDEDPLIPETRNKLKESNQIAADEHSYHSVVEKDDEFGNNTSEKADNDMLVDEFSDSDENTAGGTHTRHGNTAASRRRLKMIIDSEDDDD